MSSSSGGAKDAPGAEASPAAKKLVDLPADSIGSIAEQAGDFETILNLAHSDPKLSAAIQQWKCAKCEDDIFVLPNGGNDELSIPDGASPFLCGVCENKYCGQQGYEKRFCTSRECSGCGKLECHKCMCDHLEDCAACGRGTNYCSDCQGKCDRTCDLCAFTYCQHHGDHCDKCGLKTCGVHDYHSTQCSYCKKSYCNRCHGHGDCMMFCGSCQKSSCHGADCPKFFFGGDWPVCADCNQDGNDDEDY